MAVYEEFLPVFKLSDGVLANGLEAPLQIIRFN